MVNNRIFTISDNLFSGFTIMVDLDECESCQDIVNMVQVALQHHLGEMDILVNKLNGKNFHIHTHTFEDILLSKSDTKFYVCCHC